MMTIHTLGKGGVHHELGQKTGFPYDERKKETKREKERDK